MGRDKVGLTETCFSSGSDLFRRVQSEISYRNRYAARSPKQTRRMIPITNGQGDCLRLAVALSPGSSSSGSVGGSFGLVAIIVTSCRPAVSAWTRRTFVYLPSRACWDGPESPCDARIGKSPWSDSKESVPATSSSSSTNWVIRCSVSRGTRAACLNQRDKWAIRNRNHNLSRHPCR